MCNYKYNNWLGQAIEQRTRSSVERMRTLIENWNLLGVQKGKIIALTEEGWEEHKQTSPENYVCLYCGQSTLESKWDEIEHGFSHRTCYEQNERSIEQRLGPLAKVPFGLIEDNHLQQREEEIKLLEKTRSTTGVSGQRNPSPLDPNVERCEFVYESHDDGKTIYRRKHGTNDVTLVEDWEWEIINVIGTKAVAIADTGWIPKGLRYDS